MTVSTLDSQVRKVAQRLGELDFSGILRATRDALGLKLYKAAEFMGMSPARLKNLESGCFRILPSEGEIVAASLLYRIPVEQLRDKAYEHVQKRKRALKVKL